MTSSPIAQQSAVDYDIPLRLASQTGYISRDHQDYKHLQRISIVCRAWYKICQPLLQQTDFLFKDRHVNALVKISQHSPPPSIGPSTWLLSAVDEAAPRFGVLLVSSLPRRLIMLQTLVWANPRIRPTEANCHDPSTSQLI